MIQYWSDKISFAKSEVQERLRRNNGYIDPESRKSQAKLNLPMWKANLLSFNRDMSYKKLLWSNTRIQWKSNKFISAYERKCPGIKIWHR